MEDTVAEDVGKPGALGLGEHDVYIVRTRQAKIPPFCNWFPLGQIDFHFDQFPLHGSFACGTAADVHFAVPTSRCVKVECV
jgi:hypothetical protein